MKTKAAVVGARSRAITRTLIATSLLALLPVMAQAATPTGKLSGLVSQANSDINTTATFSGTGNDRVVTLEFRDPFACHITAPFLKEDATTATYRFKLTTSSGGRCDNIIKDVTFKTVDAVDSKPAWHVDFATKNNRWTGTLVQTPTNGP